MAIKRHSGGASALAVKGRHRARERYWGHFDKETHACQGCGASDVPLDVHHRDCDPLNNTLINLVAVCHRCHKAIHQTRSTVEQLSEWKDRIVELND